MWSAVSTATSTPTRWTGWTPSGVSRAGIRAASLLVRVPECWRLRPTRAFDDWAPVARTGARRGVRPDNATRPALRAARGRTVGAIDRAGTTLRMPAELFHDVYCDINGERDRTDDWGFALLRLTGNVPRWHGAYDGATQCGDMGAAPRASIVSWRRRRGSADTRADRSRWCGELHGAGCAARPFWTDV